MIKIHLFDSKLLKKIKGIPAHFYVYVLGAIISTITILYMMYIILYAYYHPIIVQGKVTWVGDIILRDPFEGKGKRCHYFLCVTINDSNHFVFEQCGEGYTLPGKIKNANLIGRNVHMYTVPTDVDYFLDSTSSYNAYFAHPIKIEIEEQDSTSKVKPKVFYQDDDYQARRWGFVGICVVGMGIFGFLMNRMIGKHAQEPKASDEGQL